MSAALADRLIALLQPHLASSPVLVLSGGKTPQALYTALAKRNPDWSGVTLLLTDERCVPLDHSESNQGQLNAGLLAKLTCPPRVVALNKHQQWATLSQSLICAVVGMGVDGHTASLFPDDPDVHAYLEEDAFVAVRATPNRGARLSLTPVFLRQAQSLFLLIQGDQKWQIYQQAKQDLTNAAAMPIRSLLTAKQLEVYWAP